MTLSPALVQFRRTVGAGARQGSADQNRRMPGFGTETSSSRFLLPSANSAPHFVLLIRDAPPIRPNGAIHRNDADAPTTSTRPKASRPSVIQRYSSSMVSSLIISAAGSSRTNSASSEPNAVLLPIRFRLPGIPLGFHDPVHKCTPFFRHASCLRSTGIVPKLQRPAVPVVADETALADRFNTVQDARG